MKTSAKRFSMRSWVFPLVVAAAYLLLAALVPERAACALGGAFRVLAQVSLPLLLAFAMMILLNRFVTPAHATRFLGRGAGWSGLFLSSAAGILSMGPIYAWYPFLASLREKGASAFHLACFLGHRSVKPVLLPVMIASFGWRFALAFTLAGMAIAVLTAMIVGALVSDGRS